jgi:hypothetical protein
MEANLVGAIEEDVDGLTSPLLGRSHEAGVLAPGNNEDERSRLLGGKDDDDEPEEGPTERDAAFIAGEFRHLPWWKRPSVRSSF